MAEHGHEQDDHGAEGAVDETPVNNSSIVGWGVLVMVVFWGTAAVSTSLFHRMSAEVENEKVLSVQAPELKQLQEQSQALTTYGYVDKDKQLAHIPIAEGMKQVILEAQQEALAPAPASAPVAPAPVVPAVPPAGATKTPAGATKAPVAVPPTAVPAVHGAPPAVAPAHVQPVGAAVK